MTRGQSAIEFLMSYGWAIMIMLTVVAIMFYVGIFSPRTVSPNACVLPAGFACYGYKISSDAGGNGTLTLDLAQTTGHTLYITEMACTDQESVTYTTLNTRAYTGERTNLTLTCYNSDGSRPAAGDYYRGSIYIRYTDEDTNIQHSISGEMVYRVEQQT